MDNQMKCWHCNAELIWGGDHYIKEDTDFSMVTNLSCPKCGSDVLVYSPTQGENNA
jgi:DNA-directed RNA polymerase subunit RPC12/RpoP